MENYLYEINYSPSQRTGVAEGYAAYTEPSIQASNASTICEKRIRRTPPGAGKNFIVKNTSYEF